MWKLKVEISLPHWLKKWPSVGVVLSKSLCILSKCLGTLSYECCSQRPVVSGVVWDDSLHPFRLSMKIVYRIGSRFTPGLLQVYSRSVVASMWVKFLFPDNWFMPSTRSKEVKTNGSFNENIPPHWLENWFSVRPWCPKSQWGKGLPPFRRNSLDEIVRIGSNLILTTLKTACQRPQKLPYSENIEITH